VLNFLNTKLNVQPGGQSMAPAPTNMKIVPDFLNEVLK